MSLKYTFFSLKVFFFFNIIDYIVANQANPITLCTALVIWKVSYRIGLSHCYILVSSILPQSALPHEWPKVIVLLCKVSRTMMSVQCTIYNADCTVYNIHCTVYTVTSNWSSCQQRGYLSNPGAAGKPAGHSAL